MRKRLLLAAVIIMISGLSHESVYANPGTQLDSDKLRGEIEVLINEERVRYGAAELITNDTLVENAQLRAKEVEESLSHTRPDGNKFSTAITIDYLSAGENIAYLHTTYQFTEEQLSDIFVKGWLDSEGHRNNILKSSWGQTGIGIYINGEHIYVVQLFVQERT